MVNRNAILRQAFQMENDDMVVRFLTSSSDSQEVEKVITECIMNRVNSGGITTKDEILTENEGKLVLWRDGRIHVRTRVWNLSM